MPFRHNTELARVRTAYDGATGWLVLDHPERNNALTLDMWRLIPPCVAELQSQPGVRVVVVTGAGNRAFSAGADISEFETVRANGPDASLYARAIEEALDALRNLPLPTIAMVRGSCLGGGLSIALACDLRYARKDAIFGIPAARVGIGYSYPAVKTLVDLIGPAHARDLLYTARQIQASEAAQMGLVNAVFGMGQLHKWILQQCLAISRNAPLTIRAAKRSVVEVMAESEHSNRAVVEQLVAECFESADYVEGRYAALEGRDPVFKGQ